MENIDNFLEYVSHNLNPEALYPTDLKEAIIGYVERAGQSPQILIDRHKRLKILVNRDKMSEEEAIEYFEYNVIGAFMGNEGTPCFATLIESVKS